MNDFMIWEPSPLRDALWDWWNNGFFGMNNQMIYGPPVDYPGDWFVGTALFFAMVLVPCLLIELIQSKLRK